ncbi:Aspartate/glutamate/uridylate kinase [Cokeromyces recurvatus]|uniref:Aspartate/glutamate/uridylate kinase n=1 Tax=Cokeromyces recurvatus TaxID=90255 RepID=UPI00221E9556|nr:Aspartate/glutamate/uridylate kinase [Cokeromyces recurvatus]KAI7897885.1 Aspartate/glutamate/uridylate kinase [Cokeromyces recurvatus]
MGRGRELTLLITLFSWYKYCLLMAVVSFYIVPVLTDICTQILMQLSLKSNPDNLPWIVQKYGGTIIGNFLNEIADTIIPTYIETNRVVIVCSARSQDIKTKGTTNSLLKAAEEALIEGSTKHLDIVEEIKKDHVNATRTIIQSKSILLSVESSLTEECLKLRSFLEAAQIINEISPRSKDIIIGMGEKLSCIVVSAVLKDRGIDNQLVVLNNIIQQEFTVLDELFYSYIAERLFQVISECGNKIPVLTGFFGNVPGSLLNTIGRGYTDLCAALAAVGLNAKELQIWKDVDGIFTADPHIVQTARLLPIITPEEAAELTYYGSEVIQAFTIEQVMKANIPIRIKNVKNPFSSGTVIFSAHDSQETDSIKRYPTAVTVKENRCILNIHSNRKNVSHGFLAKIFTALDDYGIVVDLISTSEVHVSMALSSNIDENQLKRALNELRKLGSVCVIPNMAIISLVGKQMKNLIGIAGSMLTSLAEAGISIEIISQGASEINISCVVEEKYALKALKAVHKKLFESLSYSHATIK